LEKIKKVQRKGKKHTACKRSRPGTRRQPPRATVKAHYSGQERERHVDPVVQPDKQKRSLQIKNTHTQEKIRNSLAWPLQKVQAKELGAELTKKRRIGTGALNLVVGILGLVSKGRQNSARKKIPIQGYSPATPKCHFKSQITESRASKSGKLRRKKKEEESKKSSTVPILNKN